MDGACDKITIRELRVLSLIGVHGHERRAPRELIFNITLYQSLQRSGLSDQLKETVDYEAVAAMVTEYSQSSAHFLIEALAEIVAQKILEAFTVERVVIELEKPGALSNARSVLVEIDRRKK